METIDKVRKLKEHCDNFIADCDLCPLCIEGVCIIKGELSTEEVEKAYDLVFKAPTAPTILDSGTRREFETGSVRDAQEGKGRMDLLPWAAIMEVSKHCENGCRKYGAHNIDLGQNTSVLGDSAARHLAKWMEGWNDEPHLLAAAWNLLWAIQMELKRPDLCDVPWRPEK
jgi:hypothetical protein